jgi:hypothetical protein
MIFFPVKNDLKICVVILKLVQDLDPDPQWFGSLDSDPHLDKKLDPNPH